ncbi:MAG: hypothetical protein ACW98F_01660 [Candidatus Hodarchaeales archaeon]
MITQIMIHRARLRLARVKHDLNIEKILDRAEFNDKEHQVLVKLSHLARESRSTIDRIQWLYNHGLFQILYIFISLTVAGLIFVTLSEIPLRV